MPSPPLLELFAVAAPGLESLVASELVALGIGAARVVDGGVRFAGDARTLYRTNLHLRIASRVVMRLGEFRAEAFHELERRAKRLPWEGCIGAGRAVALRVTCRKSRLYHSDAVAQRVADAIASRVPGAHVAVASSAAPPDDDRATERDDDRATERDDDRAAEPQVDAQLVVVRLIHDRCTVSLDSSGALLHRRGYRQALTRATLRETLAAAMLRASAWNPADTRPLLDPMCGSGTIPIEGALLARRIAPGAHRRFGFLAWPSFDPGVWESVRADALSQELPAAPATILASDRDAGAVEIARANAERAGVATDIAFEQHALSGINPPATRGWLITNPPYGVRVGERETLRDLYARLGQVARTRLGGWTITMLLADPALERPLALPLRELFRTTNGGISIRCVGGTVPENSSERRSGPRQATSTSATTED